MKKILLILMTLSSSHLFASYVQDADPELMETLKQSEQTAKLEDEIRQLKNDIAMAKTIKASQQTFDEETKKQKEQQVAELAHMLQEIENYEKEHDRLKNLNSDLELQQLLKANKKRALKRKLLKAMLKSKQPSVEQSDLHALQERPSSPNGQLLAEYEDLSSYLDPEDLKEVEEQEFEIIEHTDAQ